MPRSETAAPHPGQPLPTTDGAVGRRKATEAIRSVPRRRLTGLAGLARDRVHAVLDPPEPAAGNGWFPRLLEACVAFARRHLGMMDGALALIVLSLGLLNNLVVDKQTVATIAFTFLLAAPLTLRRRAPILVFAFLAVTAFVQWLELRPLFADTALIVALYSVAVSRPPRIAIAATIVLEVGAVLATVRWAADAQWLQTLAGLSGVVAAAVVLGVHMRARRAYVEGLLERAARLEFERDQHARLAAAAERARIAREMHDVIAHSLAVVISLANGATVKLRRDPEQSREALESISDLGRRALDDTRQLLTVLRTEEANGPRGSQPGLAEVHELVDQAAATGIDATLEVRGESVPVATGMALAAYRIIQEAVTNTVKHAAGVTRLAVVLTWTDDRLEITVDDDGSVAAPGSEVASGFGLGGMRERAALYGGSARAGPRDDGGWNVTAALPTTRTAP